MITKMMTFCIKREVGAWWLYNTYYNQDEDTDGDENANDRADKNNKDNKDYDILCKEKKWGRGEYIYPNHDIS